MAANYPTMNEYDTQMGMERQQPTYSNNLRQAGQNRAGYGMGMSYGPSASNQAQSSPWNASGWGGGTQPGYSQYASGQARGGGQPYQRPGTGPYNPNEQRPTVGSTQPTGYQALPYSAPPSWTPYQPQTQPLNQGQQATTTPWNPGVPTTPAGWNTQALRDQYGQYLSAMLPYQQYQQNAQQYNQDFNEAQRRWNEQFGWTQQGDRFNQDLSTRQQTMAEWQASEAARQWENNFGWQQQSDLFSQDLANRQLSQTGDLQRQQMSIEQAYNEGRLSNEQRQLALAELQAGQDEAWRRDQMAAQLGFSREELAATQQYRQQQDALARWQQEQQMAMQAQQLESARQNAILQATGRNQAPNVRWMRRSS